MRKIIIALVVLSASLFGAFQAHAGSATPHLKSNAVLVFDAQEGRALYGKNTDAVMPIASITKLMTAMVVLDAGLLLDEAVTIQADDVDRLKNTRSRLTVGMTLTRRELLALALMASENRAAAALGRAYPGGTAAFVQAMNNKAAALGMANSRFADATGLNSGNVASASDLVKMVGAASEYELIRQLSTAPNREIEFTDSAHSLAFQNSNKLVRGGSSTGWDIGLSKTGYLSEAGRCLVMRATIATKEVIIVLLDSVGRNTRIADANRIKQWMEAGLAKKRQG